VLRNPPERKAPTRIRTAKKFFKVRFCRKTDWHKPNAAASVFLEKMNVAGKSTKFFKKYTNMEAIFNFINNEAISITPPSEPASTPKYSED